MFLTKNYGAETYYFVADKSLDEETVFSTRRKLSGLIEKVIDRILNGLGLQYQFFPFSSFFLVQRIKHLNPDVISLHNTHGGYFQTNVLRKISRIAPVIWTLHDMWSFTGNAAHTFGNESWKKLENDLLLTKVHPKIGINTGSFLLRQKANIYRKSNLILIAPSRWLLKAAQESPVFVGKQLLHVFNGIDLNIFCPQNKRETRARLGIPSEAKVLMFSAGALVDNMWKGGKDLEDVLQRINSKINYKLHLIIVGSGDLNSLLKLTNFTVHQIGFVQAENEMANYFSASDVVIYPTKADTLPNTLVEAIACGTPCVTFDIGGCKEIIINDQTGIVIQPFDVAEMSNSVVGLLMDDDRLKWMSARARDHAKKNFSIESMAKKYYDIFKLAINNLDLQKIK